MTKISKSIKGELQIIFILTTLYGTWTENHMCVYVKRTQIWILTLKTQYSSSFKSKLTNIVSRKVSKTGLNV